VVLRVHGVKTRTLARCRWPVDGACWSPDCLPAGAAAIAWLVAARVVPVFSLAPDVVPIPRYPQWAVVLAPLGVAALGLALMCVIAARIGWAKGAVWTTDEGTQQ